MQILRWPINEQLKEETAKHYRATINERVADLTPFEVIKLVTFDGVAPKINQSIVHSFLIRINYLRPGGLFAGNGIELGAGSGFFCAMLANFPAVKKIYALEVSENIVTNLMPQIVTAFAGNYSAKVIGCVGEFDHLELPDNSLDFAFDFFSLHHSTDLTKTAKEIFRVLKKGAPVICLDKARANDLSGNDLEQMLDQEYSPAAKRLMGLPVDRYWTRRMNGETELRLKDWAKHFEQAGFSQMVHYHLARTSSASWPVFVIKFLVSYLPFSIQSKLTSFLSKGNKNHLQTTNQIYVRGLEKFPKEISLMIFYK